PVIGLRRRRLTSPRSNSRRSCRPTRRFCSSPTRLRLHVFRDLSPRNAGAFGQCPPLRREGERPREPHCFLTSAGTPIGALLWNAAVFLDQGSSGASPSLGRNRGAVSECPAPRTGCIPVVTFRSTGYHTGMPPPPASALLILIVGTFLGLPLNAPGAAMGL